MLSGTGEGPCLGPQAEAGCVVPMAGGGMRLLCVSNTQFFYFQKIGQKLPEYFLNSYSDRYTNHGIPLIEAALEI